MCRSRVTVPSSVPRTRKFGGKEFTLASQHHSKGAADSMADTYRRRDKDNARVVHYPGSIFWPWLVFTRRKK